MEELLALVKQKTKGTTRLNITGYSQFGATKANKSTSICMSRK